MICSPLLYKSRLCSVIGVTAIRKLFRNITIVWLMITKPIVLFNCSINITHYVLMRFRVILFILYVQITVVFFHIFALKNYLTDQFSPLAIHEQKGEFISSNTSSLRLFLYGCQWCATLGLR
jgi:hypothetical protein